MLCQNLKKGFVSLFVLQVFIVAIYFSGLLVQHVITLRATHKNRLMAIIEKAFYRELVPSLIAFTEQKEIELGDCFFIELESKNLLHRTYALKVYFKNDLMIVYNITLQKSETTIDAVPAYIFLHKKIDDVERYSCVGIQYGIKG